MKRRSFIKRSMLASAGNLFIPGFLKAIESGSLHISADRILVVVQLTGGNDGLNTIVPYSNSAYYKARPQLAIPETEVIPLTDELGLNPGMSALKNLYDQGLLCIINNVGYPNPVRSHFRSLDIWNSASDSYEYLDTGWIGRYLESMANNPAHPHYAIELGEQLGLALKGNLVKGMAMNDPQRLYKTIQKGLFRPLARSYSHKNLGSKNIDYIYRTMIETVSSVDYIYETARNNASDENYPQNEFAQNLKSISKMILSELNTKVYFTSLDGFDTHVRQRPQQDRLLKIYSEAISTFVTDLSQKGFLHKVLIMTYSEFGRRVAQNASGGTDHGCANNLLLIGKSLKKQGFLNESPDLINLNNGDLKHSIDFRSVYYTIIKNFFNENPIPVLGKTFPELHFI